MTTIAHPVPSTTAHSAAAHPAAARPLRRPRRTVWPYAGLVSAVSGFASVVFLSQGNKQFELRSAPTNQFVLDHLHNATWIKFGGGLAALSAITGMVFLLGIGSFFEKLRPELTMTHTALRTATAAFVGSASIGVAMRYITAGGAKGGIDKNLYSPESVSASSSIGDQLACAASLPALVAMAIIGYVAWAHRLMPRAIGAVAMLLTAGSVGATVVLGLPYSSILDFAVFSLLIGTTAIFSRKAV